MDDQLGKANKPPLASVQAWAGAVNEVGLGTLGAGSWHSPVRVGRGGRQHQGGLLFGVCRSARYICSAPLSTSRVVGEAIGLLTRHLQLACENISEIQTHSANMASVLQNSPQNPPSSTYVPRTLNFGARIANRAQGVCEEP